MCGYPLFFVVLVSKDNDMFKFMKKLAVKLDILNKEVYFLIKELSTIKAKSEIRSAISKSEVDCQKFLSQREAEMKVIDSNFRISIRKLEEERRENLREIDLLYAEIENSMSPGMKEFLGIKND